MIDFTTVKNLATKFTVTGAQKAHIDRLVFELGVLEKHVVALEQKLVEKDVTISELQEKVRDMTATITDLEAKLNNRDSVDDDLTGPTHEVLKLLFKVDEGLDRGSIRSHLDMTEGVVMFHLDTLKGLDFIGHKRGREPIMGFYSEGTSFMPRGAPEKFFIKPKGRAYIMKKG
jgi:hypothetical protein